MKRSVRVELTARCRESFETQLQDVVACQYFAKTGSVPREGTKVRLAIRLRQPLVETEEGDSVGYLPPEYEYVMRCPGYAYAGVVIMSRSGTDPVVMIRLDP